AGQELATPRQAAPETTVGPFLRRRRATKRSPSLSRLHPSQLDINHSNDPMTPVDDDDLIADNEIEIAAPCRMIFDDHFGNRGDVDALGHHGSGREREIDIADPRNAAPFEHGLANARSLLGGERRTAAAAFLGHAALADSALTSAALVHAFSSSLTCSLAALLARLALRPLPGRGLPVTLSLALPGLFSLALSGLLSLTLPGLLSLPLYAFPVSLAARARLLATLALLADIALFPLSLPG